MSGVPSGALLPVFCAIAAMRRDVSPLPWGEGVKPQHLPRMNSRFFSAAARYFSSPRTTEARSGEGAEHQAVPRGEDFVVELRADAFCPRVEHFSLCRGKQFQIVWEGRRVGVPVFSRRSLGRRHAIPPNRIDDAQNVLPGQRLRMAVVNEIALRRNAEIFYGHVEFLDGEQLGQFVLRPAVKFPLVALRCRRPRRNRIRRRDVSCRAKRNRRCRAHRWRRAIHSKGRIPQSPELILLAESGTCVTRPSEIKCASR